MYKKLNLLYATMAMLLLFNFSACSDDSSTGNKGETPDSQASINGKVEDDFGKAAPKSRAKDLEGTVVTAAKVTSNGSFETIGDAETDVNASGEFTLDVDASGSEEIVVVAENESEKLMGYVATKVENGSSYIVKPLNVKSSAETEVYSKIKADGKSSMVHKSDIETVITSSSAADIYENSSASGEVAAAIENSAEARSEFFSQFSENSESDIDAYFEAMTDAQLDYESELNSMSSSSEADAAFDAYLATKVNAYNNTGLSEKETAEFLHMNEKVLVNSMTSVSGEVKNSSRRTSSMMLALATDTAVRAKAEGSSMSQSTISAIADAGSSLQANVQSSSGSESSIKAAFETYHDEVRSAMENDLSVQGSVLITIDTEINAAAGAKLTFNSVISSVIDASSLLNAYTQFNSSIQSTVDANSALIGDIDVEVLTDILVLINMSN